MEPFFTPFTIKLWMIAGGLWLFVAVLFVLVWRQEKKKDASRRLIDSVKENFKECFRQSKNAAKPHVEPEPAEPKPTERRPAEPRYPEPRYANPRPAVHRPARPRPAEYCPHLNKNNLTDWQRTVCDGVAVSEQTTLNESSFADAYLNYRNHTGLDLIRMLGDKGMRGEFQTFSILAKKFGKEYVFSDIYFQLKSGVSSQIDIILLTKKEIYIIENKNYSGAVYGVEKSKEWTQYLGGKSFKFQNPIQQNEGHCRAFYELFPQIPKDKIVPIVVFNNLCKLKITTTSLVTARDHLVDIIEKRQAGLQPYFFDDELDLYSKILMYCSIQSDEVKQQHVQYVNKVRSNVYH